jgi:hypothetical protein
VRSGSRAVDALSGWPIVASGSGLTTVGWLLYRGYRLRVKERMHAREVASAERRHARELQAALGAAQMGAVATFCPEGSAVMSSVLPTEVTLGHPLQPLPPIDPGSENPSVERRDEPQAPATPAPRPMAVAPVAGELRTSPEGSGAAVADEPSQGQPKNGPAHVRKPRLRRARGRGRRGGGKSNPAPGTP